MPREILYATGVHVGEGEEEIASNQARDERFLDRVINDLRWSQGFYRDRDDEFERQEKWFFRDHYEDPEPVTSDTTATRVNIDRSSNIEDEHVVTINMPFSSVQRAHMMMTSEHPIIEDLTETKFSPKLIQLLYSVVHSNTQRWGSNPMHDAIFNQLLYGWGVLRVTWQREPFEEDEKFQGDLPPYGFPVEVRAVNPKEIYPVPGGTYERWKAVIHRTRMRVWEVNEQYGVTLHLTDTDDDDESDLNMLLTPLAEGMEVEVVDYWAWEGNKIVHAVVAADQFVVRPAIMKNYDSLPFTIFFCASTTSDSGENYGLGINYALIDAVSELEWMVNRHMRIIERYAEPITVIERVNDEPMQTTLQPGDEVELYEGERIYYLQFAGTIPDMSIMQQFFRQLAEEEGFALPRDGGTTNNASGIATIAEQQAALIKIFKPVENAEMAWENVNFKVIGLLQRYSWDAPIEFVGRMEGADGEKAESSNVKIRGSQTKNHRYTQVTLRAKFPLEELRYVAAAATLKNAGLMPKRMIQRKLLNIMNPEAANQAILDERVEDSPEVMGALVQDQLGVLAMRSQIMAMVQEEANAVQARANPSAQGTPEAPAPLDPSGATEEELLAAAIGNSSTGLGGADNPTPQSIETPTDALQLGGDALV